MQFVRNLDTSKACGPDGIPPRILQECALEIAPSICVLFNRSLHTGNVPSQWKSANVAPVHKKDLKEPAEHYRPISLLPIVGKVLERCVCIRLYDHVKHLITKAQHGFLRRRSCVTQLLSVLHTIGQLYDWFVDYLSGRRQRVVVNGATSSWAPVTSGVPQGSLLGPFLFVIFINDLPDILRDETLAALYADDTKLYEPITSVGDCENVQQALTNLDQWNRENNLDFNESKCKVLTITRRKSPLTYAYHMNSKKLSRGERSWCSYK